MCLLHQKYSWKFINTEATECNTDEEDKPAWV